jgi:isopentenyl-diphosphate delta-isomerase
LTAAGTFIYRAEDVQAGGTEHEFDFVLVGHASIDVEVRPDPDEIESWEWAAVPTLIDDLRRRPDRYAPWLSQGLDLAVQLTRPAG